MSEENKIPSRVSITYSVDLQEVPDRVKILLNELANSFGGVAKLCRDTANSMAEEPLESTKAMAEISSLIKKTNIRVEDCMDIMIGYIQILQAAASEPPPPEEASPVEKSTKKKTTKKKATKKSSKKKED
jgi:hypothetical protein